MRRRVVSVALAVTAAVGLSGCTSNSDIAQLNNMQALNTESTVEAYTLSTTEQEEAVYAQVVSRQLLDLSTLDQCTDNEKQQVLQFMNTVDEQLTGAIASKDGVINENYTNYLLMEFEKTPYYWQRTKTNIRGIDAESRSIVVDVTYKTIGFNKDVQKESYIIQGEPDYEKKLNIRYTRWLQILDEKYKGMTVNWEPALQKFKEVYGEPEEIFESQRNLTLTESVFETGNQKTYTGLTDTEFENSKAEMVIRYVLNPSYVLGINTGMACDHMYRVSYKLENDMTEGMEMFKEDGYATITDNIYKVMFSYFTCVDESDYSGLYSLSKNFAALDKYYNDYFDTTYRKHDGFSLSLFDISGTKVKCGVSVSSKTRAKGSDMTAPIYKDRYYVELELVDNALQVTNLVLLSSTLEGEPAISTTDAQTSGFISKIDLGVQDKQDIENLIANFSATQLNNDSTSDSFGDIVDLSISQSQLNSIKANMGSISGVKKVVWISNYMQGTANYASVRCRELFQQEDNSINECDVTYNFINKGNKWFIYSYDINNSVRLDTTNMPVTGSLCVVSPGNVDSLTSQVVSTSGMQASSSLENIGTVYEHEPYMPVLKTGSVEQGLVKWEPSTVTEEQLASLYDEIVSGNGDSTWIQSYQDIVSIGGSVSGVDVKAALVEFECMYYNFKNNRFINMKEFSDYQSSVKDAINGVVDATKNAGGVDLSSDAARLSTTFGKFYEVVAVMKFEK